MVLALVLLFILILFLAVIITAAVSAPDVGSNKSVSMRELPPRPPRTRVASRQSTHTAMESLAPHQQADPTEAQIHFTAIGRRNVEPTDETAISFEEVFASGNKPFTVGGRNDGDGGFCFLTGQRQAACKCGEHIDRRARR
jgi:hypothetical protein